MTRLRALLGWPFRNRYRAIPFFLFVLGALWFALFLQRRDRLRAELAAELDALRGRGEPVALPDFESEVNLDDPGLKHLARAMLAVGGDLATNLGNGNPVSPWPEFRTLIGEWTPSISLRPADWTAYDAIDAPTSDPALAAFVVRVQPALAELEAACAYPATPLPHDFRSANPMALSFGHLLDVRRLARACRAATFLDVEKGDARAAWRHVFLGFQTIGRLDPDPFVISRLVQCAILNVAHEGLVAALSRFDPTPNEFEKLDALLAACERFNFRSVLHSEQAAVLDALESGDPIDVMRTAGIPMGPGTSVWHLKLMAAWSTSTLGEPGRLEDRLWLLRSFETRICACDDLGPAGAEALEVYRRELSARRAPSFIGYYLPSLAELRDVKKRFMVRLQLARGALRVVRRVAATGKLPDRIEEFADEAWPPKDAAIFGPAGVQYEKTATGFRLRHPEPPANPVANGANAWLIEINRLPERRSK
jgi:hypothetical protein